MNGKGISMTENHEQLEAETSEHHGAAYVNFWEIALRRKSLIALGVVTGIVLGLLYYSMRIPIYRSEAQVLLIKKRPDSHPLTGGDPRLGTYEDYLATHQILIRSPLIIGRAAKKLQGLTSFGGSPDPTFAIIGSLNVTRETPKEMGWNSS